MISRVTLLKNLFDTTLRRSVVYCSNESAYICKREVSSKLCPSCHLQSSFLCNTDKLKVHLCYQPVRTYAKSKDKQRSGKGQKKKVEVSEDMLADVINSAVMKEQMQAHIEKLKDEFIKNLSLRSTSGSIETLSITYEGKDYILQELAQIVRKNPKTVVVNMTSFPQVIPTVLQALSKSGMNLSPQQDGTTLFIPIPKVTKEHRENLSKNAKALFIKCKDNIKDVQNKFVKTVKNKEKAGLSQDTSQLISEYVTFTATEYISAAEKIMEAKQQELLKDS